MKNPDYNKDFYAWSLHSAELLRQGKFQEVDMEHVAEELESMENRDRHALVNRLAVLIAHLLKWQIQASRRGRSWKNTIKEQRKKVRQFFMRSPGLKNEILEKLSSAYELTVLKAGKVFQSSVRTH